jgi:EAL and modified HD-GYP domain-containing signal transduction protein
MSISVTFNSTHRVLLASEFFLARRPVVDRQQDLVAHELLFCAPGQGSAALPDEQPAMASVIADVCQHGLARVIGDVHAILYVDHAALMSDMFRLLPADRIVLELAPADALEPDARERLVALAGAGFRFAALGNRDSAALRELLPLVEVVRIDVSGRDQAELPALCQGFKAAGKRLLAERVDTPESFELCRSLGFDFFQGYYFAVPRNDPARRLSSSEIAITELTALIASDADSADIEQRLKSDVTLGLKMLRMANVPAFGHHRIDSLRQALMVVGRNQLQRWLQLMLYAEAASDGRPALPLLAMAATRGRLVELAAQKLRPANRGVADSGFTVGIMSLMDTLFSMPMEDILRQMPVGEEVAAALLAREGYLGKLLSLAEYTEWAHKNDAQLQLLLPHLKLAFNDLYSLQLAAFEWSDAVVRHARTG